ncbi:hypothetical protein QL285_016042 [Trifolium repens]|nr:hypothetical protein QL285_016042 [Trifolium repens]
MELVLVSTGIEGRYLAWYWYYHLHFLSNVLSFSFLDTNMLDMLYVPLYHVLRNFSGINRNIKRVENRLDTTGSSTNELDSSVDELIVIR